MLLLVFGVNFLMDKHYNEKMETVANYHHFMSIPALTILEKIDTNFMKMNAKFYEDIAKGNDVEIKEEFFRNFENTKNLIQEYDDLRLVKNNDKYLADQMMREQMHAYASDMQISLQNYHDVSIGIFSNEINQSTLFGFNFDEIVEEEKHFLELLSMAKQMESQGQNINQAQINSIVEESNYSQNFLLIISVGISLVISILIINSVNSSIKNISKVTQEISSGKYDIKLDKTNDEFDEISNSINQLSNEIMVKTDEVKKQERLSAIGELSARLAHDLRNPLSAIKLSMDIIKHEAYPKMNENIEEKFRVIDRAIHRISHQVENVLEHVREKELQLSSCNISDIVKDSFASIAVPKNVKIKFELSNNNLVCDRAKIETLITNLLVNAVQAVSNNGEISVKTKGDSKSIIIEVQDSGLGVDSEFQEMIFEPLFTTKQRGTGLGLASCKRIVEQHKGTIECKSNPSTFVVKLPILKNPLVESRS
ncbi:hypothetical protein C6988_05595 [Nitrosopumilus sp. b1]|nr:hypothetical protein C6988_05595 [Nitrosopumilus sp. b1]